MSIIGPRPGDVESKDTYAEDEKDKLLIRPGITGYTQHLQDGLAIVNMEEARRPEKNCSLNMEKRQEHRYMYTVL